MSDRILVHDLASWTDEDRTAFFRNWGGRRGLEFGPMEDAVLNEFVKPGGVADDLDVVMTTEYRPAFYTMRDREGMSRVYVALDGEIPTFR